MITGFDGAPRVLEFSLTVRQNTANLGNRRHRDVVFKKQQQQGDPRWLKGKLYKTRS